MKRINTVAFLFLAALLTLSSWIIWYFLPDESSPHLPAYILSSIAVIAAEIIGFASLYITGYQSIFGPQSIAITRRILIYIVCLLVLITLWWVVVSFVELPVAFYGMALAALTLWQGYHLASLYIASRLQRQSASSASAEAQQQKATAAAHREILDHFTLCMSSKACDPLQMTQAKNALSRALNDLASLPSHSFARQASQREALRSSWDELRRAVAQFSQETERAKLDELLGRITENARQLSHHITHL